MAKAHIDPNCLFCSIASGAAPSHKIAETAKAVAFLDIHPLSRGHALVIPKVHGASLADLSAADRTAVFELGAALSVHLQEALEADGLTIGLNDGMAAGQEVLHVHLHLVPRWVGDGGGPIHFAMRSAKRPPKEDFGALAKRLHYEGK